MLNCSIRELKMRKNIVEILSLFHHFINWWYVLRTLITYSYQDLWLTWTNYVAYQIYQNSMCHTSQIFKMKFLNIFTKEHFTFGMV